jgi:hypothetical protein
MEMEQLKASLREISDLLAVLDEHAMAAITGTRGKSDKIENCRLRVNGYVAKPVDFEDIDTAAQELLWLAQNQLPKMWSEKV